MVNLCIVSILVKLFSYDVISCVNTRKTAPITEYRPRTAGAHPDSIVYFSIPCSERVETVLSSRVMEQDKEGEKNSPHETEEEGATGDEGDSELEEVTEMGT